jgi:hypothetical protein
MALASRGSDGKLFNAVHDCCRKKEARGKSQAAALKKNGRRVASPKGCRVYSLDHDTRCRCQWVPSHVTVIGVVERGAAKGRRPGLGCLCAHLVLQPALVQQRLEVARGERPQRALLEGLKSKVSCQCWQCAGKARVKCPIKK